MVSTSQNKGFIVKINLHLVEKALTAKSIWKMEKNWFPLAKKPFPRARMKDLFQKYIHRKEIKWLKLASGSTLTNQNAGHVYKYVSIRRKNKAIIGRSVWKWKKENDFH